MAFNTTTETMKWQLVPYILLVLCCENDRVPFHSVLEIVTGLLVIAPLKGFS